MSVQVRRRREAASFLSTYVGAQGELLVDTTSNRVQVHDGATPGGWAAAGIGDLAGRNAAINGNFAINQRGYTSGTALAAGAYGHDRWKAGAGGGIYTFTPAVPDTTITITAGTIVQAVDAPNAYSTACWLTWIGSATARVWQGTVSGAFGPGTTLKVGAVTLNALLVTGLTIGTIVNVEFGTGTLGLVQLEAALPNAGPTRFDRRHGETALCARYYQRINFNAGATLLDQYCGSAQNLIFSYAVLPMRAAPTISVTGLSFSNGSSVIAYGTATWFEVSGSATGAGRVYVSASASGAFFELNAEI